MTRVKSKLAVAAAKELIKGNRDGLREIVRAVLQEILEAEMTDALGAAKSERTAARLGYRAGYYGRTLINPGRQAGAAGPAGPRRPVLDPCWSSATGGPSRRWSRPWPRCACKACRPGRSRRSPKSCAGMPSRPRRSRPSTSARARAWRFLPGVGWKGRSPT